MTKLTLSEVQNLRPEWDNILVRVEQPPAKSAGGIYIPATHRTREQAGNVTAVILATGPHAFAMMVRGGEYPDPPKVGDRVVINQYSGHPLLTEDVLDKDCSDTVDAMHRIVNHQDIVARI